jgi:exodeoxyribonuclease VII small subunit
MSNGQPRSDVSSTADDVKSIDALTFEDSLTCLEAAVRELEDGQLGLSEALERYEQSVKHLKRCYQLLEAAEQKIELLTGVADDGTPCTEPFIEASKSGGSSPGRRKKPRARTSGSTTPAEGDIDASAGGT